MRVNGGRRLNSEAVIDLVGAFGAGTAGAVGFVVGAGGFGFDEVLLGVGADLRGGASANVLLHLLPVLPVRLQGLQKTPVLILCPAPCEALRPLSTPCFPPLYFLTLPPYLPPNLIVVIKRVYSSHFLPWLCLDFY